MNGDIGRKSQIFPTPCILRPRWRIAVEFSNDDVAQKNRSESEWCFYHMVKKIDDMIVRLDTI